MQLDTSDSRTRIAIGVVVVVVIAVLAFVLIGHKSSSSSTPTTVSVPKGFTNVTTVTTLPPNVPHPAEPKPSTPPPEIYATGACGNAMTTLRALFAKYPSGLTLDAAGSAALTADLKVLDSACTPALDKAFRTQELTPWLNYAVTTTTAAS